MLSPALVTTVLLAADKVSTGFAALLFIFVSLVLGALCRQLVKGTPFSYTVVLMVFGVGLAELENNLNLLGEFGDAFNTLENLDPHLILNGFLPVLIFESAFNVDQHIFRRSFGQILLMALPGLLVATSLTAVFAYYVFDYDGWSWYTAFMFGAMISATDPVAVVALLGELGVNKRLGTVIEGESLLNDGLALLLFVWFFDEVTEEHSRGAVDVFVLFVRLALGGPLWGLVMGLVTVWWLGKVFNDPMVEITITLASAYVTFVVGETVLEVSGVLAVVVLGLMVGGVGRSRISPEVEEFLHRFWQVMGYIANTLIFVLVGVIIAGKLSVNSTSWWYDQIILYVVINAIRLFAVGALYPLLQRLGYGISWQEALVVWWGALRGAVGLALALVVIQYENPQGKVIVSEDVRFSVFFHTAGTVFLTLVVNGGTIRYLISYLGLTRTSRAKAELINSALRSLRDDTQLYVDRLRTDRFLKGAQFDAVLEALPELELRYEGNTRTGVFTHGHLSRLLTSRGIVTAAVAEPDSKERTISRIFRFLRSPLHSSTRAIGSAGPQRSSNDAAVSLRSMAVKAAADEAESSGGDASGAQAPVQRTSRAEQDERIRALMHQKSMRAVGRVDGSDDGEDDADASKPVANKILSAVEIVNGDEYAYMRVDHPKLQEARTRYIKSEKSQYWHQHECGEISRESILPLISAASNAMDYVEGPLDQWRFLRQHTKVPGFLRKVHNKSRFSLFVRSLFYGRLSMAYDVCKSFLLANEKVVVALERVVPDARVREIIRMESAVNRNLVMCALKEIRLTFPQITVAIKTRQAVYQALDHERHKIEHLLREGVLDDNEAERVRGLLEQAMKKNQQHTSLHGRVQTEEEILTNVPWLRELCEDVAGRFTEAKLAERRKVFDAVQRSAVQKLYKKGKELLRQGDTVEGVFIIVHGIVEQRIDGHELDHEGPGGVVGMMSLLSGEPSPISHVAVSQVKCYFIPAATIRKLMRKHDDFASILWNKVAIPYAKLVLQSQPRFCEMSDYEIMRFVAESEVQSRRAGDTLAMGVRGTPRDVILLHGTAADGTKERQRAPAVLSTGPRLVCITDCRLLVPPHDVDTRTRALAQRKPRRFKKIAEQVLRTIQINKIRGTENEDI